MDSGRTFQEIDQGIREVYSAATKKRGLKRIARRCSARVQRRMKETEERVIELRNSGKTFQEIAGEMGWKSRERARQIDARARAARGEGVLENVKGGKCEICGVRIVHWRRSEIDLRFHASCLRERERARRGGGEQENAGADNGC